MIFAACLILLYMSDVAAHVSLIFPPARWPPLDFIDNVRTPGPCGVPKADNLNKHRVITDFQVGSQVNIAWELGYAHKGGYRIELLDPNGSLREVLFPPNNKTGYAGENKPLATSQIVNLPWIPCRDCTIRQLRQANEWGPYEFRSCADVNILPVASHCLNGGIPLNGVTCKCPDKYRGDKCQYKDECARNIDCGRNGRCISTYGTGDGTAQPLCFCQFGFFGEGCKQKNKVDLKQFDPETYSAKAFGSSNVLYWKRIGQDELEIRLESTGRSWISIGWKPEDTPSSCQKFPVDYDEMPLKTGRTFVPMRDTVPLPNGRLGTRRAATNGGLGGQPRSPDGSSGKASSRNVPQPRIEPEPEPVIQPEPETKNEPESIGEREPSAKILHPMDCTDIVIGMAQGSYGRVVDSYTRDRSTPLSDEVYGGSQSLTAAGVFLADAKIHMVFRRKIDKFDPADQTLSGNQLVIFAKGQAGDYEHSGMNDLGLTKRSLKRFFDPLVPKYHGLLNRAHFKLNFLDYRQEPMPTTEPEPTSEPETKAEPAPKNEPGPKTEPDSRNEPNPKTEPEPTSEPETKAEPGTRNEPEPKTEPNSRNEPVPKTEPEPTSEPETKAEPGTKNEPESNTKPDSRNEPVPKTEPEPTSEPVTKAEPGPKDEPGPKTEPDSRNEPVPKTEPEPTSEPETKAEPGIKDEPGPITEPDSRSEPVPNTEPESTSEHETTAEPGPKDEPGPETEPDSRNKPVPKTEPEPTSEPKVKSEPGTKNEPQPKTDPETVQEPTNQHNRVKNRGKSRGSGKQVGKPKATGPVKLRNDKTKGPSRQIETTSNSFKGDCTRQPYRSTCDLGLRKQWVTRWYFDSSKNACEVYVHLLCLGDHRDGSMMFRADCEAKCKR